MTAPNGGRELWLVRHGETPASLGQILAGSTDVPLTAHGEEQASALRPLLAGQTFDGVWSSDLQRAVRTARLAWGEPTVDRRLREMAFGTLEGVAYAAIEARWQEAFAQFEGLTPPEGESFDALRARVFAFVGALPPGRHLVFTHGCVLRTLSRELGGDYFVPTGTLLVVDWDARRLLRRPRPGRGRLAPDHLVGQHAEVIRQVVQALAHEPLHRVHGGKRVLDGVPLGLAAHRYPPIGREAQHTGDQAVAGLIANDLGAPRRHHRRQRVGGAEVDAQYQIIAHGSLEPVNLPTG